MAKTYEELLASGSHLEIMAVVATNTKRVETLFGESAKRADKAPTQEELDEITRLDTETEALQTKAIALKKIEDIRVKNAARQSALTTPDYQVPFSNGNGDPTKSEGKIEFAFAPSLKNFKGATNDEAAEKAYRFGKFIQGYVANAMPGTGPAAEWCKAHNVKIQQEGVPQDGGVLVPVEFERTLIDLREQYGSFRPNAKNEPMSSETKIISRRTGGLTVYFVGEAVTGTASSKTWDAVTLVAKKLMAVTQYTTEIAEDAFINIADDLAGEIAYAFSLKEDQCGFLGDGSSTYGGITGVIPKMLGLSATIANIAGIRVQGTISTGTFAGATLGDFQATIGRLPKYADTPKAKWYMHKSFFHVVAGTLADAAGGNTTNDIARGPNTKNFLGYPVEFAQVLPSVWVANQIFALFGDLSLAASFGDRRQTTLFTDPYSLSTSAQVQLIGSERFDLIVHDCGNASATAALRVPGPIVAFASAAS